jgi:intracellular sulfur oxidation DsrE/DsrF family protein
MTRLLASILLTLLGGFPLRAVADDPPPPAEPPLTVVVHVNFADTGRQGQGLKNIENVLKEVGDTGATVEFVCHGGGIGLVEKTRSDHAEQVSALIKRGVRFVACRNTMKQKSIKPEDLIPGVEVVPAGALEVIRKQHAGYAYFRP